MMVFIYDFFIIYKRYFGIQKYTNFNELFFRMNFMWLLVGCITITPIKQSYPNNWDFVRVFFLPLHIISSLFVECYININEQHFIIFFAKNVIVISKWIKYDLHLSLDNEDHNFKPIIQTRARMKRC